MNWVFDNDRPIYIQLVEQLKLFIVSGIYQQGQKLPSVREFAMETQVNPNTMQKALAELEACGLVYTQRTSGRFVTQDKELIKKMKHEMAIKKVSQFLKDMQGLGLNQEQTIHYIENNRRDD